MYPKDAITVHVEISGNTTNTVVSGNNAKTILGITMVQQNVASDTSLRCGNTVVAKNYATSLTYTPLNYVCYDTINILKTGNDSSSVIVTYVLYDTSLTSTTTQNVNVNNYAGMTFHESLFVAGVIIFLLSFMVWGKLNPFKRYDS